MSKTLVFQDELTDEGQKLWNSIAQYEKLLSGKSVLPKPKPVEIDVYKMGLIFVRIEIKRLIENSKRVIKDCDDIIDKYTTVKEYLSSDAKIAKMVHTNLIQRLERVLNWNTAFDHEIVVDDDEPNKLYYDNTKRKDNT